MKRSEFIMAGMAAVVAPKMSLLDVVHRHAAKSITIAKTSCGFERDADYYEKMYERV